MKPNQLPESCKHGGQYMTAYGKYYCSSCDEMFEAKPQLPEKCKCICHEDHDYDFRDSWCGKCIKDANHPPFLERSGAENAQVPADWEKEFDKKAAWRHFEESYPSAIPYFKNELKQFISQTIAAREKELVEEISKEAYKVITVWDLKDFYKYLDNLKSQEEK